MNHRIVISEVFNFAGSECFIDELCKLLLDSRTYEHIEFFIERLSRGQLTAKKNRVLLTMLNNLHLSNDPTKILALLEKKYRLIVSQELVSKLLNDPNLDVHFDALSKWFYYYIKSFVVGFFRSRFNSQRMKSFLQITESYESEYLVDTLPLVSKYLNVLDTDTMHVLAYFGARGHWCKTLDCPKYNEFLKEYPSLQLLHSKQRDIALQLLLCLRKVTNPWAPKCAPGNINLPKPLVLKILFLVDHSYLFS